MESAPAAETPGSAAGVDTPPPSLLEKFDADQKVAAAPPEEAKPADLAPTDKPADAKPVEEPKTDAEPAAVEEVPPVDAEPAAALEPIDYFEKLSIPETLKLDDAMKGDVVKALDAFRADPVAGAQGLIDLHNRTMTDFAEHMGREQHRVWNETRQGWVKEVMADPVLGGAGFQTAMGKVAQARDVFVSAHKPGTPAYEADRASFDQMLSITGVGDHPAMLRFLHNAQRYVREAAPPPPDPKPPKDIGKAPGRKGLGSIYTHPTSNPE